MAKKESTAEQLEPISGLGCPKCLATEVAELPANGISPHPGFKCLSCGAKLRGMTGMYLAAIVIGLGLLGIASGIVPLFGDERDEQLRAFVRAPTGWLSAFAFIPLYVLLVAFSVRQLLRPRPRRLR